MTKRAGGAGPALCFLLLVASPPGVNAQEWGIAVSVLNTEVNAVGLGGQGGFHLVRLGPADLNVHVLAEWEWTQHGIDPRYEKEPDPSDGFFYYRDKVSGVRVHPDSARTDKDSRFYAATYLVLDVARLRAGLGVARHPLDGAGAPSAMLAFEATPRSTVVLELPDGKPFRLRLEVSF